ncbi:hypothetical protein BDP27DRAFT_1267241 [Rhodocollybia butyracea]|uniref:DUF6535 domain-containing protein n=1 Tax=Rhodocollybia butyracea TaxID=206335 RepID=A0A9P5U679_9AGAR|nr:hypothetical protein BDP27DRAFT_1267241 [Rhodocollybia butyracea]
MNYSEEMLSLIRSMHSMMQAREEREATILRFRSSDYARPAPVPVTSQLTSNMDPGSSSPDLRLTAEISTLFHAGSMPKESLSVNNDSHNISIPASPHIQVVPVTEQHTSAHPSQTPDPPNIAHPVQASDPPAGTLTSILNSLHKTILDLQYAVTGSEKSTKNGPFKAHRFGLKKDQATRDPLAANYDYTLKYPEDERYHELDQEARIWRVYGDEATAFDNDMVAELNDSLNVLLVFAGLFSVVLTIFVAQTSQSLSQDYTQLSASYLSELTMLVRANINSATISNIPLTSATFSPAILDLWVNGLWFTSLATSLSVALVAVLAKQWLYQYMSIITGTPRQQALIRQFRFDGLEKWQAQSLIGMLPTLLHLALILFLVGLIIFLIPLSTAMAYIIGAISVTVVVFYFVATVLPLFTVQCPYRTTLTHLLYSCIHHKFSGRIYSMISPAYNWVWKRRINMASAGFYMPVVGNTLEEEECFAAHRQNLGLASLTWLGHYTSNPSAKSVLFQSLGAFPPETSEKLEEVTDFSDALSQIHERLCASTNLDELEVWFRAGSHFSSMDSDAPYLLNQRLHSIYESNISDHNCDITSALSALAFGLSPVKFFHAGQCIQSSMAIWDTQIFLVEN